MGKTDSQVEGFAIGTKKEIVIQKPEDLMTLPQVTRGLHKNLTTTTIVIAAIRVTHDSSQSNFQTTRRATSTTTCWRER